MTKSAASPFEIIVVLAELDVVGGSLKYMLEFADDVGFTVMMFENELASPPMFFGRIRMMYNLSFVSPDIVSDVAEPAEPPEYDMFDDDMFE